MKSSQIIQGLIEQFCSVDGRSVRIKIIDKNETWEFGFHDDIKRPAASLLKILVAAAVEEKIIKNLIKPTKKVLVQTLIDSGSEPSILRSLELNHTLTVTEIIQISLSTSDPFAGRYLLGLTNLSHLKEMLSLANCLNTEVNYPSEFDSKNIIGRTTARDALNLIEFGSNSQNYPITAKGLSHSVLNSRIPLGIVNMGTQISHKTGTLLSVAHDVALIKCREAAISVSFLTENQDDTLQTGYEMGICMRRILETLDLSVEFSRSYD